MQTATQKAPRAARTSVKNGAARNGSANGHAQNAASTRAAKTPMQDGNEAPAAAPRQPYHVSVEDYMRYRRDGFLVVPQLVSPAEIAELRRHTDDLMQGRLPEQQRVMGDDEAALQTDRLDAPPPHLSPDEKAQFFLRIHMLHRVLKLHERYLLHPRVLDVLEALIGPDVMAMQTMLFLKPPGKPGQGWHQDSFYIPTVPDTLIGAWIAIDDCDEQNGGMWMAQGSQVEPIYPPASGYGFGTASLDDLPSVGGVSDVNDDANDLSRVAAKYPQVMVSAKAGDVVFFNSHILHRSKQNFTTDRYRRSFVSHYANARSFTQWGGDPAVACGAEGMTNTSHILARGDTHLPFGTPRFGTPCDALLSKEERGKHSSHTLAAMAGEGGMMDMMPTDPQADHDDDDEGTM